MKSFVLGFSTLLALASPAVATAQTQVDFTEPPAATDGTELNQDGAYAPELAQPGQPMQPMQAMPQAAASFGYFGPHPLPYDQGSGFCQHTGAHAHEYPVFDTNLFRMSNGYAYFVGDPSDFGYQNQVYVYRAEHPIADTYGGGNCYMNWAHRHWFQPASSVDFSWDGGAFSFVGAWAPSYYTQRPYWTNYYNTYYRPYYLGGGYYSRRPAQVYGGWGWHRPVYGSPWNRGPVYRGGYGGYGGGYGGPVYRGGYGSPWNRGPIYRGPMVQPRYVNPPVYRAPQYQAPQYRAPMYQAPAYRAPMHQAPQYRAPMYQAPAYRAPMHQAPQYRAPAFQSAPAYRGGGFSAPVHHGGGGFGGHHGGFGRR